MANTKPVQITYPFSLPYQIVLDDSSIPLADGSFYLHTRTVDGVGDAVSVRLGPSTLRNCWQIATSASAVTTEGEVHYAGAMAQLVVASDGLGIVELATPVQYANTSFGFGGFGKLIPTAAIADGYVYLIFTPEGDATLPTSFGVSGVITSAVA